MKIVLVDDHTLFRVGVRHVLATPPGFEVIEKQAPREVPSVSSTPWSPTWC